MREEKSSLNRYNHHVSYLHEFNRQFTMRPVQRSTRQMDKRIALLKSRCKDKPFISITQIKKSDKTINMALFVTISTRNRNLIPLRFWRVFSRSEMSPRALSVRYGILSILRVWRVGILSSPLTAE